MSHKHRSKIEKLFEHPVSVNIDVRKLISSLEHYGVSVEMTKHNKTKLYYNGEEITLSLSIGHDMSKDEILKLRHYLEKVDLVPGKL